MVKPKLLSPAGSFEALCAAVQNGADEVYLGGAAFSARASAQNFDDEELIRAVRYCHIRGVRVLVAINTLMKQKELGKALRYASFLYKIGVDALIIQDLGLAKLIHTYMPDFPLHASTQMSVHNVAGAKALEGLGYKRVVLARELSAEQIKKIKSNCNLELEVFIHGAICQSVSGQCLFSSLLGGRSGNRGRCAQPCRLMYSLQDMDNNVYNTDYLLSPKDLCLLDSVRKLTELGIDSLKIEGRLKRKEYVAAVTSVYRSYIDYPRPAENKDITKLLNAFNRSGFTDGYFSGKTGSHMMSYKNPANVSEEKFDADVLDSVKENTNLRKTPITAYCIIKKDEPSKLILIDADGNSAEVNGDIPEAAINVSLDEEKVLKQISKLGGTPYNLSEAHIQLDEGLSLAASELNRLRREAAEKLDDIRAERVRKEVSIPDISIDKNKPEKTSPGLTVEVRTREQLFAAIKFNPARIYAPQDVLSGVGIIGSGPDLITRLDDYIVNDNSVNTDNKNVMTGIIGMEHLLGKNVNLYGDFRLNVYNGFSLERCRELGFKSVCISPELNLKEIGEMTKDALETEVIVYGHLSVMLMKNCVIKAAGGKCAKGENKIFYLKDRKNEKMPVLCHKDNCYNELLNSKPVYMADKINDVIDCGVDALRLNFTVESAEECERILSLYTDALASGRAENPFDTNGFTRGHFYRGVD